MLHLGYIEGEIWIQHYLSGEVCLRADLRHTLNEDLTIPYFSQYIYEANDNGVRKKYVTMYLDELPIEAKGKEINNTFTAPGYTIIKLCHPNIGPIEIRFSAAWHDPFEHFWTIKNTIDNNDI